MSSGSQSDYLHKPDGYFASSRSEMLEYVPDNARNILDVGCSAGGFGQALKQLRGAAVFGIELNAEAFAVAEKCLDGAWCCDAELFPYEEHAGRFDCIVFNDILEHLVDPWTVLRRASVALAPNGVIIASLPNVRYYEVIKDLLLRRAWTYVPEGVLDRTHLRFFTLDSGKTLFQESGYRVVSYGGLGNPAFPWKFGLLNNLLLGLLNDMRFMRMVYVARLA